MDGEAKCVKALAPSHAVSIDGFFCQLVSPAGMDVFFDLAIPLLIVKLSNILCILNSLKKRVILNPIRNITRLITNQALTLLTL
jgi:hypothetical protein